ncbi:DUF1826 domain-containing protein [Pseudoalteromonas ruthenica]|uniref:DUF1826 domain-containing protein n=1 Tax=Pseudoalteromonas ruthenica TaxID=151081 RepID=UPI0011089A5D|nr:DUF1826 domain-containing protein [Pseudoalteromonas ruthenica]TLX51347.1 DUF1826 domain-containing protein [Pseudoalteromonas ruthenica]TMO46445.1 DUF1826 domain-containing protein [Pseudoalteromonas ruthenica]TMO50384.1 DUF1826 domain-containing protein [Pseudoalteromonas ruthenica]
MVASTQALSVQPPKTRVHTQGNNPTVLTDIFKDHVNMVVWRRELSADLLTAIDQYISENPSLNITKSVEAQSIETELADVLSDAPFKAQLDEMIAQQVAMFACLFELQYVGLRLKVLEHAMCPRFHVDKVPCRLITTFSGLGTQWLAHDAVNREKLGEVSKHLSDEESGLYADASHIKQLNTGDVALLKGELWEGNEGAGLVHRSPALAHNQRRLILTLDFG